MNNMRYLRNVVLYLTSVCMLLHLCVSCSYDNIDMKDRAQHIEDLYLKARQLQQEQADDSASMYYLRAISEFDDRLDYDAKRVIVKALNNRSYLRFHRHNDYYDSYKNIVQAANLAEAIGYDEALPNIYLNTGYIALRLGDYSQALDLFRKSFHIAHENANYNRMVTAFIDMSYLCVMHDMRDSIREEESIIKSTPLPDSTIHKKYVEKIIAGIDYLDKRRYDEAVSEFSGSASYVSEGLNPGRYRIIGEMLCGLTLAEKGDYKAAISKLEESAESNDNVDFSIDAYSTLEEICGNAGLPDNAVFYHNAKLALQDSLMPINNVRRIKDLERDDRVTRISEKLDIMYQKQRYRNIMLVMVSVFSAILLIFLAILWRSRKKLLLAHRQLYRQISGKVQPEKVRQDGIKACDTVTEVAQRSDEPEDGVTDNDVNSPHPSEESLALAKEIDRVMGNCAEIHNADFTLVRLAALLNSQPRRVSKTIKEVYGVNFSSYVAGFRIREAARRLADSERYGNYTIQAISEQLGFRSRSNFISLFKSHVGMTPSEYVRISRLVSKNEKTGD